MRYQKTETAKENEEEKKPFDKAAVAKELEALSNVSTPFYLGEDEHQREYILYPITLGKISLLTEPFMKIIPLVDQLRGASPAELLEIGNKVNESIEDILNAFEYITYPNDGTEARLTMSKEDRKVIANLLTIGKIIQLFDRLKQMAIFEGMLKNLTGLSRMKNLDGPDSSEQSSDSHTGD